MITNTFKAFPVIIALLFVLPSVSYAQVVEDQGNASNPTPAVAEQGNASVQVTAPTTVEQGHAAQTGAVTPSTQEQGNASVVVNTEDQGNGGVTDPSTPAPTTEDQGHAAQTGSTPNNPGNNPGGTTSGGGSGNYSSSGGRATTLPVGLPTLNSLGQCEYITTYMKLGGTYEVSEVTKLQNFLKTVEAINVSITGVYDEQTANAVKAFQAKYLNEVMLPWGANVPSGQVYFTTKKKINEIYCKSTFALTAEQLAQIEAYKLAVSQGLVNEAGEIISTSTPSTSTTTPTVGSATTSSQTASVADTSFFSKVWNFIKRIFGR